MRLVLAPWEWDDSDPPTPRWIKPGGDYTGGCLDLRTVGQVGTPGPTPAGLGLFAYDDLPPGIDVAADLGDDPLARMKLAERNALADALGLDRSALSDAPLGQILAEQVLGSLADPSGASRTKPLRMNGRGAVLRLKGFGELYRAPLDKAHPVYAQTLAVRRLDYVRNRTLLLRRLPTEDALAVLQRWTGWDMRALRATEDELLPVEFRADGSRRPSTTLTETWPTNGAAISTGQDQPWNEDFGDVRVSAGELLAESVVSNEPFGRCTTDLSSDDHSHDVTVTLNVGSNNVSGWPLVRKIDSTTKTFYGVAVRSDMDPTNDIMYKCVAGTFTALDETVGSSQDGTHAASLEANGSSISGETPQGTVSATDTDITGNLQCGYHFRVFGGGTASLDDHTMEDLPVTVPRSFAGSLSPAGAVSRQAQMTPAGSLSPAGDLVRASKYLWDETFERPI